MNATSLSRRDACRMIAAGTVGLTLSPTFSGAAEKSAQKKFRFNYILASSLYGTLPVEVVLEQAPKTGAQWLDIWPKVHGNQREQMEEMGHDKFAELLRKYKVRLGCISRYDLGPFGLQEEMKVAKKFGARLLICHSRGPKNLEGEDLKKGVAEFLENLKPHIAAAEEQGVVIGIENHSASLIHTPDSIRYFNDGIRSKNIGLALAPYHLPQDPGLIAQLIDDLGPRLAHFYAWEHGKGSMTKLPKEEEMLQLPGYGSLDFKPILASLKKINFQGWTSIFMHPVPRGIPILPTAEECTAAINKSRDYLERCLAKA